VSRGVPHASRSRVRSGTHSHTTSGVKIIGIRMITTEGPLPRVQLAADRSPGNSGPKVPGQRVRTQDAWARGGVLFPLASRATVY
jgi:hypothetical protein